MGFITTSLFTPTKVIRVLALATPLDTISASISPGRCNRCGYIMFMRWHLVDGNSMIVLAAL